MNMKKDLSLLLLAALLLSCLPMAGLADTAAAPEDFTFDTVTGKFTFNAVDKNIGYYFVRVYSASSGVEAGEYTVSSKRLNGGKTGEIKGSVKLDDIGWGPYHVKLVANAAAGTGIDSPAPVVLNAFYGVGGTLERPEAMAFYGKNRVQIILDWWTLCDYLGLNYMPYVKITFWADAECTQEVFSDTIDTYALLSTLGMNPPGIDYIWGYSQIEGTDWMYKTNKKEGEEETQEEAAPGPMFFSMLCAHMPTTGLPSIFKYCGSAKKLSIQYCVTIRWSFSECRYVFSLHQSAAYFRYLR